MNNIYRVCRYIHENERHREKERVHVCVCVCVCVCVIGSACLYVLATKRQRERERERERENDIRYMENAWKNLTVVHPMPQDLEQGVHSDQDDTMQSTFGFTKYG